MNPDEMENGVRELNTVVNKLHGITNESDEVFLQFVNEAIRSTGYDYMKAVRIIHYAEYFVRRGYSLFEACHITRSRFPVSMGGFDPDRIHWQQTISSADLINIGAQFRVVELNKVERVGNVDELERFLDGFRRKE